MENVKRDIIKLHHEIKHFKENEKDYIRQLHEKDESLKLFTNKLNDQMNHVREVNK